MTQIAIHLVVTDPDQAATWYTEAAAWARALGAGASVFEPVHDAFWGDRTGQLLDPFGHRWALDEHVRDVSHDEIVSRAAELFTGSVTA
ncbi:hypothetical protein [Planotetraspora mira]|nr:hypothetical protein [Planotetraspora mira]